MKKEESTNAIFIPNCCKKCFSPIGCKNVLCSCHTTKCDYEVPYQPRLKSILEPIPVQDTDKSWKEKVQLLLKEFSDAYKNGYVPEAVMSKLYDFVFDKSNRVQDEDGTDTDVATKTVQDDSGWEEKLEKSFDEALHGCGVGYGKNQLWLKTTVSSILKQAQTQILKEVMEKKEIISYDDNDEIRGYVVSVENIGSVARAHNIDLSKV